MKSEPTSPTDYVPLTIVPVTLTEANTFVAESHRHHDPVTGHKFSIGIADDNGKIRGVAIVGRPVSRMIDNGWTLEVNRCCTDGVRNGCSMLYRSAWKAVKAMGYRKLITYTLKDEGGSSLRGAGFKLVGERGAGSWNRKERPRFDTHPTQTKLMWEFNEFACREKSVNSTSATAENETANAERMLPSGSAGAAAG